MRKIRIVLVLGVWVVVLPYLGFPFFWKNILLSLTGLGVVYIGYALYREYLVKDGKQVFDNFSENSNFNEKEGVGMDSTENRVPSI
ncbi:hypothetical protein A3I95_01450 [Candidatus Nomurabacteria bacterium RIFCSPLOWO2_02_FULL_44_12]|uniref:Uncharacterized protein n=1 Tax=Candidatus Nomurabacteria bacterium RIFCSPLOWO2_12_FULL_44_11 TaxID=1801796 RepID=A0A1F6Y3A5_9BACT|nr:MAG: hypothetical protein A3E95_00505 [Candidatus Nomurabacteria bacterium RIFCSPHIGHO2_12_FULL_44_22b]OGJ00779.1 MAG: hypothetical protein A3G53_03525 [Candidatus Nomurabacteria bacterium RIFCSPLOWO2_12_FULL_44_11]OGJ07674.1 MAG: hypothetical protein A3I95_01450 [Candidatus Nomurabacteria bacterium RIFCSPLOWO2_02_FULL_44_12]